MTAYWICRLTSQSQLLLICFKASVSSFCKMGRMLFPFNSHTGMW